MRLNLREKIGGILFLIGLAGATFSLVTGKISASKPLQSYSIESVIAAPHGSLPRFIRLTGSISHGDLMWTFRHSGKAPISVSEMPLTTSDWNPGQPAHIIETEDSESGDCDNMAGYVEGALSLNTLPPGWGSYENPYKWRATMPVYLLHCLPLNGKTPNIGIGQALDVIDLTWPAALFFLVWSLADRITTWKKKRASISGTMLS